MTAQLQTAACTWGDRRDPAHTLYLLEIDFLDVYATAAAAWCSSRNTKNSVQKRRFPKSTTKPPDGVAACIEGDLHFAATWVVRTRLRMRSAACAAPKPLSMLTDTSPGAQLPSALFSANRPPALTP